MQDNVKNVYTINNESSSELSIDSERSVSVDNNTTIGNIINKDKRNSG